MKLYFREPKKARNGHWYANPRTIEVYHDSASGPVVIHRKMLEEYMRQTKPKKAHP